MATARNRYVNTASAGGDGTTNNLSGSTAAYITLNDCLTAEAASGDLVSADVYLVIHCEGTQDTETCDVTGYTVDETRYIQIIVDQSVRHHGVWSTSHYYMGEHDNGYVIDVYEHWTRIEGVQIWNSTDDQIAHAYGVYVQSGVYGVRVECSIFLGQPEGETGFTYESRAILWNNCGDPGDGKVAALGRNNIFINQIFGFYIVNESDETGPTYICENNTAYGNRSYKPFVVTYAQYFHNLYLRNNVAECNVSTGGYCYNSTIASAHENSVVTPNVSNDTSSPDTGHRSMTATYEDEATFPWDLHLDPSDTVCIGEGTDLTASFTKDIDGETRPSGAAWCIGADEYVAAGGETVNLIANIAGASSTPGVAGVLARALLANAAVASSTPNVAATVQRNILAAISAGSSIGNIQAALARSIIAAIPVSSLTPEISAAILRALLANIGASSTTPDITATMQGIIELVAGIAAASSTPDAAAQIARALLANMAAAGVTPDITATIQRNLLTSIAGASTANDIAAAIARAVLAAISASSLTPDISALVARALSANVSVVSTTPDITATIQGIISLVANITGVSSTSEFAAQTVRELIANIPAGSTTADVLASSQRNLIATLPVSSSTPDITATIENMVNLSAAIVGASVTPDISATIARILTAAIMAESVTPELTATVARTLVAAIAGTSVTPDDLILILAGLGVILDPSMESVTPVRAFESVTVERTIEAL